MSRRLYFFLFTFIFLAVVAIFIKWVYPHPAKITNFEECAKAGYKVMESYPRQCDGPRGNIFVEQVILEK